MENIKEVCPPCKVEEVFIPREIEPVCKPCPTKVEDNSHLYPISHYIQVREDCLKEMLINMTTKKFCKIPPRGCDGK